MENTYQPNSKLKQSVVEWNEFTIPDLNHRGYGISTLLNKKIISIIGPRRAGKTFACFEIMSELLNHETPRANCMYINFEDERLVPLDGTELTNLLDVQEELYPRKTDKQRFCFLDEVHNVPNWSKWVRRVTDQNQDLVIILTGSSSRLLSTEIATELRGRASVIQVFPYSFKEFLNAHGMKSIIASESLLYSSAKNGIKRHFNNYFERGGFPAIAPIDDYRETLQEYYRAIFARDMVERFTIKNVRQFEDFLKILITRFSSLTSVSSTEKEMTALGYHVSKNTLMTYLGYARDAFLLFDVCKYDHKVTRQIRAPRKLYAIDHGLINAVRFSSSEDRARLLENIVFIELRRRYSEIYYHSEKYECDFLVVTGIKVTECIQVCWSINQDKTRERELRGLTEAMDIYSLDHGTIITEDEHATFEHNGKKITVVPFWFWALA